MPPELLMVSRSSLVSVLFILATQRTISIMCCVHKHTHTNTHKHTCTHIQSHTHTHMHNHTHTPFCLIVWNYAFFYLTRMTFYFYVSHDRTVRWHTVTSSCTHTKPWTCITTSTVWTVSVSFLSVSLLSVILQQSLHHCWQYKDKCVYNNIVILKMIQSP